MCATTASPSLHSLRGQLSCAGCLAAPVFILHLSHSSEHQATSCGTEPGRPAPVTHPGGGRLSSWDVCLSGRGCLWSFSPFPADNPRPHLWCGTRSPACASLSTFPGKLSALTPQQTELPAGRGLRLEPCVLCRGALPSLVPVWHAKPGD